MKAEEKIKVDIVRLDIEIKEIKKDIILTLKKNFSKLSANAQSLTFELLKIIN